MKDWGEEWVSLYFIEGDLRPFDEAEQETQKEDISCGQRRGTPEETRSYIQEAITEEHTEGWIP